MVTIVVLYNWYLLSMELTRSNQRCFKKGTMWGGDVSITWVRGILSPHICISNHHAVHSKHITILFVSYTSIKLEKTKHRSLTGMLEMRAGRSPLTSLLNGPGKPSPLSISVQLSHLQSETSQFPAQSHEAPKTTDDCAKEAKAHVRS